jgi:Flp pilus assembly protein TadD
MSFWRQQVIQPSLDSELDVAIQEQLAALERNPADPRAHFALGTLRHLQGDSSTAASLLERALTLDPEYAAPHVSLGRIRVLAGHYESAWQHAHRAAALGDRSLLEQMERYPNLPPA